MARIKAKWRVDMSTISTFDKMDEFEAAVVTEYKGRKLRMTWDDISKQYVCHMDGSILVARAKSKGELYEKLYNYFHKKA